MVVKALRINTDMSKIMQIERGVEDVQITCRGVTLEMAEDYTYLRAFISRNGRIDQ